MKSHRDELLVDVLEDALQRALGGLLDRGVDLLGGDVFSVTR